MRLKGSAFITPQSSHNSIQSLAMSFSSHSSCGSVHDGYGNWLLQPYPSTNREEEAFACPYIYTKR